MVRGLVGLTVPDGPVDIYTKVAYFLGGECKDLEKASSILLFLCF